MAKQNFLGLVKFTGASTAYEEQKALGKLIFAEITSPDASKGKYIYANGIEYKVADSTDLDELIKRVADVSQYAIDSSDRLADLSTFVRENVNVSVGDLSTRLGKAETSIGEVSTRLNEVSTRLDNASTRLLNVSTRVDALEEWKNNIDSSIVDHDNRIIALETKDQEIDASISDISTRLSTALASAVIDSVAVTDSSTVVTLTTTNKAGVAATSSFKVAGNGYVTLSGAANNINVAVTTASVADATVSGEGLADAKNVKDYVDQVLSHLDQALKFISDVTGETATQLLTTDAREAGDTFVASGDTFTYDGKTIEASDLVIVKVDSVAGAASQIMVVERNLDGAVTAGAALATNSLVIGTNGTQAVETTNITVDALNTAIANANSALQTVTASTLSDFVTVAAVKDASAVNVSVGVTTHDVSTATAADNGLATALGAKEYVDAKTDAVKVQATLNSSTPDYVDATASVDAAGRVITAGVGVKTATLADAANGSTGLATAEDVYEELTKVEEVMATANAAMATTIGLNSDYSVNWSTASGISPDTSIVKAIEEVAAQAAKAGVTSFGEKKGDISIDSTVATDGSVAFAMDGSTLKGTVVGWSGLVTRVSNNETSIGEVSTRVNNVSTRLNDLSTYVHTTVDTSVNALETKVTDINASINRLNTSVSTLETWKNDSSFVNTVEGEAVVAGANTSFVYVNANPSAGDVKLTSGVVLANNSYGSTSATGLATDAYVQDFLSWEVIG